MEHPGETPRFLSTARAAEYLGLKASTLIRWRARGFGPPVVRLSVNRSVYSVDELDRFAAARQVTFGERQLPAAAVRP